VSRGALGARSFQTMVMMRDGARLNTFVFLPENGGPRFPVILHRTPTSEFLACEVHKQLVRRIEEGALGSQASTSLRVVLRENQVAWSAYDAPLG
jgi:predicted acyl esterase